MSLSFEVFPLDRFEMDKDYQDRLNQNDPEFGRVKENQQWHRSFNRYQLSLGPLTDSGVNTFERFYYSHAQPEDGEPAFLFEDPKDKSVTDATLGIGDGSSTVFRFKRTQSSTSQSHDEIIRFLQSGTVTVYEDGSAVTGTTIDRELGTVTFNNAPSTGTEITADFDFYHLVEFTQDPQTEEMIDGQHQRIDVTLEEVE